MMLNFTSLITSKLFILKQYTGSILTSLIAALFILYLYQNEEANQIFIILALAIASALLDIIRVKRTLNSQLLKKFCHDNNFIFIRIADQRPVPQLASLSYPSPNFIGQAGNIIEGNYQNTTFKIYELGIYKQKILKRRVAKFMIIEVFDITLPEHTIKDLFPYAKIEKTNNRQYIINSKQPRNISVFIPKVFSLLETKLVAKP